VKLCKVNVLLAENEMGLRQLTFWCSQQQLIESHRLDFPSVRRLTSITNPQAWLRNFLLPTHAALL